MTVAELGDRMSSRELSEWMAYYQIEPWGEERADLRQAMTTSATANLLQSQSKHPKWTKPADFMLLSQKQESADSEPSPDDLKAKFLAFTSGSKK